MHHYTRHDIGVVREVILKAMEAAVKTQDEKANAQFLRWNDVAYKAAIEILDAIHEN